MTVWDLVFSAISFYIIWYLDAQNFSQITTKSNMPQPPPGGNHLLRNLMYRLLKIIFPIKPICIWQAKQYS